MRVISKPIALAILFILAGINTFAQFPQWSYLATGLNIRKVAAEGNYLWVATESGLVQYDKQTGQKTVYDKTNSGLRTNLINYVHVDAQGAKWIATRESGLYKFSSGTWTNYNSNNSQLPDNNIQTIVPDTSGALWLGTFGGGLVKLQNNTWTIYDSLNTGKQIQYIYSLAYDMYGYLWVGTAGEGLFRFDGINEWVAYNTSTNNVLLSDVIKTIVVDNEGNKWIGTESGDGGGLYKFDGSMFTLFSTGGFSLNVYAIAFDNTNALWVGTYGGGIAKLQGTSWTVMNTSNSGLPDNAIKCFYFDQQGVKWIGTEHKGLVKYSGTTFTAINLGILPNHYVFSMAKQADGTKWIGTKNFLTRYQNGTIESIDLNDFLINPSPGLPPNFNVWAITFDAAGNKWIGTYDGGLVRFSPLNIPKVYNTGNSGMPSDNVYSLVIDKQDVKWIGTSNGLVKYDGTTWKTYNTSNSPLPNNYITSLVIDKQNKIWICTTNGVAKFDGVNWSVYTTASGLPGNYTFSVAVDSLNNKWIGTGNGLAKFNNATWTSYNTGNSGLPQDVVQYVQCDALGNVWVGTGGYVLGGGITKFNGSTWETYNSSNSGLSGDEVSSFLVDENGKKWIGTFENGVSIFDDSPAPVGSIAILSPAAGAVLVQGSTYTITWNSSNVTLVKIEVSTDNGNTWNLVNNSVSASNGSYQWSVPTIQSMQCVLRLSDASHPSVYAVSGAFQIASSYCKDVTVASGWNLVSVPVQAASMHKNTLFPTNNSPMYSYGNGYLQSDSLVPGTGYWLRFPAANLFTICGGPTGAVSIPLSAGWNLIAPFNTEVSSSAVTTVPSGIINSPFYSYSGSYQVATALTPGKGYWVRSSQAGVLTLNNSAEKSASQPVLIDPSYTKISVSDAANNVTTLYYAPSLHAEDLVLPPVPPAGIFDVRFADNFAGTSENISTIELQGASFPVTMSVDKGKFKVTDVVGGRVYSALLEAGQSLQIGNSSLNKLRLEKLETPLHFELGQNYPNPFNPATVITYTIASRGTVTLRVYDVIGNEISTLVNQIQEPGQYTVQFKPATLSSGIYIYRLQAGSAIITKKMTFLK